MKSMTFSSGPVNYFLAAIGPFGVFPQIASGADAGILEGLLASLRQVDRKHQPPVVPVDGLSMLRRRFFGNRPQRLQVGGGLVKGPGVR